MKDQYLQQRNRKRNMDSRNGKRKRSMVYLYKKQNRLEVKRLGDG